MDIYQTIVVILLIIIGGLAYVGVLSVLFYLYIRWLINGIVKQVFYQLNYSTGYNLEKVNKLIDNVKDLLGKPQKSYISLEELERLQNMQKK